MPYYDKDQIEKAREMDLLTYLQSYEPDELVTMGHGVYCTRTHDSLKISRGLWCWWSHGVGGRSALDYLTKVRGLDFTEAVGCILRESPVSSSARLLPQPPAPKPFELPERHTDNRRVFAYLRSRSIDPEIINHCIKLDQVYEEREHHNAVFVGFSGDKPLCASMRSTLSSSTFLRDVDGSDKKYSFSFTAPNDSGVLVTESAIDLLSCLTLAKRSGRDWRNINGVSLAGVYKPKEESPTVPLALEQFLQDHPQIRRIDLCLDNDDAGREAAAGIIAALPELEVTYRPPEDAKDYNDLLRAAVGSGVKMKTRGGTERE